MNVLVWRHCPLVVFCDSVLIRLKENLGKVGGTSARDEREKEGEGKEQEAENEFVRASKEKFSETKKVFDENSVLAKIKCVLFF